MSKRIWGRWLRRALVGVAVLVVTVIAVDVSAGAFLRDRLDAHGLGDTVAFSRAQPRLSLDGATLRLAELSVNGSGAALQADSATIAEIDPLQPDPMGGISVQFARPMLRIDGVLLPEWLAPLAQGETADGTVTISWSHDPAAERASLSLDFDTDGGGRVTMEAGVAGVSRAMLEAGASAAAAVAGGQPPPAESIATLMPLVSSLALTGLTIELEDDGTLRPYLHDLLHGTAPDSPLVRLAAHGREDGAVGAVVSAVTAFADGTTDRLALRTTLDEPIALLERRGLISWGPAPLLTDPAEFIAATGMGPTEG